MRRIITRTILGTVITAARTTPTNIEPVDPGESVDPDYSIATTCGAGLSIFQLITDLLDFH
jgi:hypothetical protein